VAHANDPNVMSQVSATSPPEAAANAIPAVRRSSTLSPRQPTPDRRSRTGRDHQSANRLLVYRLDTTLKRDDDEAEDEPWQPRA
jgi:hypothetical protein